MQLYIETTYTACTSADVTIPIDKWEDIVAYYIKNDTFHYAIRGKDGNHVWAELYLESDTDNIINWIRPNSVIISDPHTGNCLANES